MEVGGLVSALVAGVVIGSLGRLAVPGRQPIGCLLTILVGIVGAAAGAALARSWHTGFGLELVLQVVAAALLVALFTGLGRGRRPL